jgi:hypothetical protein
MDIEDNDLKEDDLKEDDQLEEQHPAEEGKSSEEHSPQRKWGPQILGAMVGAFVFLVAGGLANQMGWATGTTSMYLLWGAAIGSLFGSTDALNHSGKILTKSDNKWLNIGVSLLGMVVIAGIFLALVSFSKWLLSILKL